MLRPQSGRVLIVARGSIPTLSKAEGAANTGSGHAFGLREADIGHGDALMPTPQLLLLGEPSLGLAPLIVRDTFTVIRSLQQTAI